MKNWTVAEIKKAMIENGGHWWDKETIKYFGTQIVSCAYVGKEFVFFVTSERQPTAVLCRYTVRRFNPKTLRINTEGKFFEMERKDALRMARELARN